MHLQNLSIWRKIGMVFLIPILLVMLPFLLLYDKVENWWCRQKRKRDW